MSVTSWLVDPVVTDVETVVAQRDWPPCPPSFSADAVRNTARGENGDPLAELPPGMAKFWVYSEIGFTMLPPALLLRSEVIARLTEAEALLPAGLSFVVLDGWRPLAFQRELADYYSRTMHSVVRDLYVSDPADDVITPPHVTGGAVDLTLQYAGEPLALGTDYDAFEERADLDWFERVDDNRLTDDELLVRTLRRCLSDALSRSGFAQYPREWWHWSYGDQWWAARYSRPQSVYSAAT